MIEKTEKINIDGHDVLAEIQIFDNDDRERIKDLYKKWAGLCIECEKMKGRKINIPEIISEPLFCIEFNSVRFLKGTKISSSFDCLRLSDKCRIQVKASSVEEDLTSFGPKSKWDEIYFIHFFSDKKYDGSYSIYKIEDSFIYNHKVNKTETFRDQQKAGKRPRFSIIKDIIKPNNILPIKTGNILDL